MQLPREGTSLLDTSIFGTTRYDSRDDDDWKGVIVRLGLEEDTVSVHASAVLALLLGSFKRPPQMYNASLKTASALFEDCAPPTRRFAS